MQSPVGKIEVGDVSRGEQKGREQFHNLEKLEGAMCEHNGYVTVPKDCT